MAVCKVNVAWAKITLARLVDRLTLAVAVEDASVPLRVVVTLLALPCCGITETVTVVPTGIFEADNPTETGLVVVLGSAISGDA